MPTLPAFFGSYSLCYRILAVLIFAIFACFGRPAVTHPAVVLDPSYLPQWQQWAGVNRKHTKCGNASC